MCVCVWDDVYAASSGARYTAAPDIQMNDRMPRTRSSPEACCAGERNLTKLHRIHVHIYIYAMTCTSPGEKRFENGKPETEVYGRN